MLQKDPSLDGHKVQKVPPKAGHEVSYKKSRHKSGIHYKKTHQGMGIAYNLYQATGNEQSNYNKHFGRGVPSRGMADQPRGKPQRRRKPHPSQHNKNKTGERLRNNKEIRSQSLEQIIEQILQRAHPDRKGQLRQEETAGPRQPTQRIQPF